MQRGRIEDQVKGVVTKKLNALLGRSREPTAAAAALQLPAEVRRTILTFADQENP
jgi:hypothetical protein